MRQAAAGHAVSVMLGCDRQQIQTWVPPTTAGVSGFRPLAVCRAGAARGLGYGSHPSPGLRHVGSAHGP